MKERCCRRRWGRTRRLAGGSAQGGDSGANLGLRTIHQGVREAGLQDTWVMLAPSRSRRGQRRS